ncbi:ribbon-helix-helix protein, CopG family [Lactobacillus salivarius]|uniref:Ribbon-helix-helix protein, CopG family n=1 Tax=Ligilactobacillus salivarius TaxID=1624 RepID=A0A5C8H7B7_9LACO|nr:ribbon-helix-helix protein, CopG family [Ligilactobacillus salivarius]MYU85616.1 ribbon-helix-helix protein, CopG family [Ligilactobacillus salivarius]MYU87204.1 ribbon-helix-helix protein, CopG family [Ligilactobacillus salivarius]MYY45237.1 ribbon-helix-helix protein, CopG family [Ligilactobacillus salivarius]MYY51206.1 ribbon-helix-helix protein, CopG family [Ligilactobacillus salivarius]
MERCDAIVTNKNKRFTLRASDELATKLEKKAQRLGVSKNALILFTLEKELNNEQKKK